MKKTKLLALHLSAATVVLIAGCDSKPAALPLPEVNADNCAIEKIRQISPKERQQEFAGLCLRRSSFVPSTGKTWTTNSARPKK